MQNSISEKFKSAGLRATPIRQALMDVLERSQAPLSIKELSVLLGGRGLNPNKTTLYRQITSLLEIGLLEELTLLPGLQHFEWKRQHHHHFSCRSCESVWDVESDQIEQLIYSLEQKLARQGHQVDAHQLEWHGRCVACA